MVMSVVYVFLSLPVNAFIENYGCAKAGALGSFFNLIGAIIKCFTN